MTLSAAEQKQRAPPPRGAPNFLEAPPRHFFFTGKGGVGKTSLACASAVFLADAGRRVLLVSTDPASNLDAVLQTKLANTPTATNGMTRLDAMNIDPEQAARDYRERTVAPYRSVLPSNEIALLEERLSGACTVEVAAFDEFALLLGDREKTDGYDHVIFDTAPTGHTLRLLELPAAWTGFLEASPGDASCLGPLSGLRAQRDRYEMTVRALSDPASTEVVIVARPDRVALLEAARTSVELRGQGMTNQHLVINAVYHAGAADDPLARAVERRGAVALAGMPKELKDLPQSRIPLRRRNIVGLETLRGFLAEAPDEAGEPPEANLALPSGLMLLHSLVDAFAASDTGIVMVMGKGGVGKTTVAAAVAVALAARGKTVHLTTTDPAQHLHETLSEGVPNLRVTHIDPKEEVRQYRAKTVEAARTDKSPEQLALLREELQSPCYEELAVFQAFSRVIVSARKEVVVIDTAPTGHTLLLLDTAGAYHRQLTQNMPEGVRVRTPLMLLQDRNYTRILIVTLPETTPVLEAAALQDDLRRAGIEPFAWIINSSLAAAETIDPVLRSRAAAEVAEMAKVTGGLATRVAVIPFQAEEPVGAERLLALAESNPD
ncbi:MAG: arsenical pump-driving ATPase [Reyranella sp.]|uniref:arsenical pump-driving ATPase n=1 Tax=Reyranella sp. TaxID=1929291 RepID=UPI003D148C06